MRPLPPRGPAACARRDSRLADVSEPEVVVQLDGLPRPATVVHRAEDQVLVRFRQAGGFAERWVPASAVIDVEPTARLPLVKLVGMVLVGALGLALLLWPGGSDKPLLSSTPTPSPSPHPSPSPTATVTTAVLFGDSFAAGRGNPPGTPTALSLAAKALGWRSVVLARQRSGFTTTPSYGERLAQVTSAPDVLLLEGGASDTEATSAQLTAAASSVIRGLKQRFPTTRVVLMGPVAMEQPPDQALTRVGRTLAAVARAQDVAYVNPLPWITAANAPAYLSPGGFYPNAKGHAYLGAKLATALRALTSST